MGYQYLADASGNPRQDGIQRIGDAGATLPAWVPNDPGNMDWRAYQAWLSAGNTPMAAVAPAAPARAASLSALLDPLSPAQRAAITADHKDRLQAEASEHPGGLLQIGNAKVVRAAGDLGLTPDAWFTLAGF